MSVQPFTESGSHGLYELASLFVKKIFTPAVCLPFHIISYAGMILIRLEQQSSGAPGMDPRFIHLRLHTEYSLSDGLVQLQPMVEAAVKNKMPAVAVTDQSNLFAVIKFYQTALGAGIKPIIGADLWLENDEQAKQPVRFSLYCQNQTGYKNLLLLISKSYLENQHDGKAILKRAWLEQLSDGLIALSGAKEGDIGQALLGNNLEEAEQLISFWHRHFPDRYYIELQRTGRSQEETYIHAALQLAEKHSLPVVATNDVHFLNKDDFEAHEARVCIHEGHILADPRRPKNYSEQQYFRTQEEMIELFSDIPESLENTVEIAKRCNVTLTLGKNYLPNLAVPAGFTSETHLIEEAKKGLEDRLKIIFHNQPENIATLRLPYDLRLKTELEVINKMGFAGYFLIVADFIQWARTNNVPVGPGRGSGPGSLVAYALKITDLDPLAHELLFERFLNPERVSLPDFDIDFCMEGRDRVIDYVMERHGRENVSQIITYGSMAAKAVVRDVGRVLGLGYGFVDKIAKLIPFEIGMTLDKALETEELLKERYNKEDEVRTLIDLAKKLEGIARNAGKHAGGVVIAPGKLTEFTPLYCEADASEHVVTQFDKDDVEAVGLVKFDFLGLRTLTTIHWGLQNLTVMTGESLDIHLIPMNDAETFALLKACKTTAIFQLESRGMRDLVKRLQPDCFEDIVALVALFRPGPLQSGMVDDFINRKHGRSRVQYPHPKLEPILRPTYGVILYQEQVMQIAQVLAGYSLGSADILRRAMGKKKPEEMAEQRAVFCKGAVERGVDAETATHIFDLMEKFAGYGFNKSHSASYALIAYQTAWLKAHKPAPYMAAVLSSDMDHTEKVVHFIEECQAMELKIAPPEINHSDYAFKVKDEKNLVYGLGAIKGVGKAAIDIILEARAQGGPFKDLFDFCQRVDARKVNKRVMEALIKSGTLDQMGAHRASLMNSLDIAWQHAEQQLRDVTQGQHDLFGCQYDAINYVECAAWPEQERLFGEKETLGYYLTGHPIHRYLVELKNFATRIVETHPGQSKTSIIAGVISAIRTLQTKKGDRMAVLSLDDSSGQMDVLCFADVYHKYREILVKDKLIVVEGEVSMDEFTQNYRLIGRELYSMEQARERHAKYVKIKIQPEKTNHLSQLANVLEKFRGGKCSIKIDYARQDAAAHLQLGENWRVRPVEGLLALLREIFLEHNVEVVY